MERIDVVHVSAGNDAHVIVHGPVLLRRTEKTFGDLRSLCALGIRQIIRVGEGLDPKKNKAVHRVFGTHVFHQGDGTTGLVTGVHHSAAVQQYADRQEQGDRQGHDQKREQRRPAPFPQVRLDSVANKHTVPP